MPLKLTPENLLREDIRFCIDCKILPRAIGQDRIYPRCSECMRLYNKKYNENNPGVRKTTKLNQSKKVEICKKCGINIAYKGRDCNVCHNKDVKEYFINNPHIRDKIVEKQRGKPDYQSKKLATDCNSRAKKYNILGIVTKEEIENIITNIRYCEDCGIEEDLTVGHMFPLHYPASVNSIDNIIIQCKSCNSKQGKKLHSRIFSEYYSNYYAFYHPGLNIQKVEGPGSGNFERKETLNFLSGIGRKKLATMASSSNKRVNSTDRITAIIVDEIYIKYNNCCGDCGSTEKLTLGHLIPLFYPIGKNIKENLMLQCSNCNHIQSTKIHISVATEELRQWYPVYTPINYLARENSNNE